MYECDHRHVDRLLEDFGLQDKHVAVSLALRVSRGARKKQGERDSIAAAAGAQSPDSARSANTVRHAAARCRAMFAQCYLLGGHGSDDVQVMQKIPHGCITKRHACRHRVPRCTAVVPVRHRRRELPLGFSGMSAKPQAHPEGSVVRRRVHDQT